MDTIIVALIIAIPPTAAAIAALIVALGTSRQIHDVHLSINSRFDEWIKMAKLASFAEGRKSVQDERIRYENKSDEPQ